MDTLNEELLIIMKNSDYVRIKAGVESGNDKTLEFIKKGITTHKMKNIVNLIHKINIPLTIYLILRFPNETDIDV